MKKPLVESVITKINEDIDQINILTNENKEENNSKIFYLADKASTNKRCVFCYL